ncbi:carrier protein ymc1 [Saxophila tyrrhenica]|uniref:Carrier protein ymc1 n=1 Tax=Saxophila tyrrhenica TaxID=1690608 RepID=A0AAV9PH91_9PEZI|nr:carrier protein ymc1 [Saxophila tyrrhenica]
MAEALEEAGGGVSATLKDLFSGAVGGVAQVLIVKVRLQTTTTHPNALSCATSILRNEGATAFYKGTLTPLIGIGACVSVQFGGFNYARRAFEARNAAAEGKTISDIEASPQPLSYGQYYASGAFAGVVNTVLSSPIEHIRIRLQTQPHGANRLYAGPLDCIAKLSRSPSIPLGLYRGTSVTLLREAQAYGCWFLTFEYLMQNDAKRNGLVRKEIPTWKIALYGGIAGEMLWISSYPFDVIKSKMQTDEWGEKQRYKSMRDAFAQTWKQEGAVGFWRGIGPTLLRAMPVSAGTFAVVELMMRLIT